MKHDSMEQYRDLQKKVKDLEQQIQRMEDDRTFFVNVVTALLEADDAKIREKCSRQMWRYLLKNYRAADLEMQTKIDRALTEERLARFVGKRFDLKLALKCVRLRYGIDTAEELKAPVVPADLEDKLAISIATIYRYEDTILDALANRLYQL